MTDQAIIELTLQLGVRGACEAVGVSQAGLLPAPSRKPGTGTARARPAPPTAPAEGA